MLFYLLLGYLFYGSLMTGIGAITNNMREAQQFAFMFTFVNFVPFILITNILAHPDVAARDPCSRCSRPPRPSP